MGLTRILLTAAICSSLSFGATAHAKGSKKHHSSKGKTPATSTKTNVQAEETVSNEDSSGKGATTTTTTTNPDDTSAAPSGAPSEEPSTGAPAAAGSETTTTTTTTTTPPADTAIAPVVVPVQPVTVQPVEVAPAPAPAPQKTFVFLPMVAATDRAEYGYTPPIGIAIMAGGGAFDFVGGTIKAETGMGGFWNVRVLFGSRSLVGAEANYLGTLQSINALGLASDANLLSNGVEGTLRLNAPIAIKRVLVEPFGFAGAGWSRYSVVNTNTQTAALQENDNVILLPVGGGIEVGYSGFFLDARYTYRFSYDNNLVQVGNTGLDNWNIGGSLGYEF